MMRVSSSGPGKVFGSGPRETECARPEMRSSAASESLRRSRPSSTAFRREPPPSLLSGDAGIGKTTLWIEALRSARARAYTVLPCSPGELETKLAYSALADILEEVVGDVLDELPEPQRLAIEHALLRAERADASDQHAVSLAFLAAIRALARRNSVVLAIDDLQWLDASSARVLQFALRRLTDEPIGVVVALRSDQPGRSPPLLRSLPVDEVSLGPLASDALDRLLRYRLGTAFLRPTLAELERAAGGNPFFALELAAALLRRGEPLRPGDPLPVSDGLRELLADRIALLPESVRDALLVVAAVSNPSPSLVDAALDGTETRDRLAEAIEAGVSRSTGAVSASRIPWSGRSCTRTHPRRGARTSIDAWRPR